MQKTLKAQTNDFTSVQTSEEYGRILILDTTKDASDENGKPVILDAETFKTVLEGLGYIEGDRILLLAASIFTADTNANVKIYGEDTATGPNATINAIMAALENDGLATEHILLTGEMDADTVKEANSYTLPLRKLSFLKIDSIVAAEISALKTEANSKNLLTASGIGTVAEDGFLAGFIGRHFPGTPVLSSLKFDGLQENIFSQTDENELLGNAYGTIDSDGNGGVNLPCLAEGEVKMLWGTTMNGKDVSTEYFKNWLDDEIELVGGRYISTVNSAGRALRGRSGANELASVLTSQVLGRAVTKEAIRGDIEGNALGVSYTAETGELRTTDFEVVLNGRVAEITYNILRETGIVAGDVTINLHSGVA